MAQIYGTGLAWKEITAKLAAQKLEAANPGQVASLLDEYSRSYEQQLAAAQAILDDEIQLLEQELGREKELVAAELAASMEKFSLEIAQSEAAIDLFRQDKNIFGPFGHPFRLRRETRKLENLRKRIDDYRSELERPLRLKESMLEHKKTHRDEVAREQCSQDGARVELLKTLDGSPELAQALAEDEMLACLRELPDDMLVLNHLSLKVERGFRQGDRWLVRGLIDHLVLTSSGLFAIQVMNPGKPRTEKPPAGGPGAQIDDASRLCYLILKPEFPSISVRGVLAYRSHVPENAGASLVKTLTIPEVCSYILWFKDNTLDETSRQAVLAFLQNANTDKVSE